MSRLEHGIKHPMNEDLFSAAQRARAKKRRWLSLEKGEEQ